MDDSNAPRIEEELHHTPDGLSLYACWHLVDDPIGVVVLTHGLGEHSSRYGHVIHQFQLSGLTVLRFDQRGHGRSDGPRGHISSYNQLMDDMSLMVARAKQQYPGLPVVLFGHSLGGNLVANWAIRRRSELDWVACAVLTAPWFTLVDRPPWWKVGIIRALSTIWPGFVIPANLRPRKLTRNPQAISMYEHDPMIHKRITARMAVEVYDAAAWALQHAEELQIPALGAHGTADPVTSPVGTKLFCYRAPRAEAFLFDNLVHEPHNEPEWQLVVGRIRNWILQQIEQATCGATARADSA